MSDILTKIVNWIKSNYIVAGVIALVVFVLVSGKSVGRMFSGPRRRRRRVLRPATTRRRTVTRRRTRTNRKPLPRSVGTRRKGYPAAGGGTIPFKYNKDGTVKKAWQVGGTVAAKSRMSRLRKSR